ncbi:MAG: SecY-interacting protein [Motiliproteus sp.]|nr:SecY-interacting protein [Motiliproteus sp.]MCW9053011.1 SecY-interacting protein [Motiliproteus sp.]
MNAVEQALDRLIDDYIALYADEAFSLPMTEYDDQWPSECYQQSGAEGKSVPWRPCLQSQAHSLFDGLEQALELPIHEDIKTYYNRYWSDPIPARFEDGDLSLLFVWNEADFERLRGNLIGHALAKHKIKQPLTFFFACTEPEELVLSLQNDSGRILLEQPGKPPLREVANSLAEFLDRLKPLKN